MGWFKTGIVDFVAKCPNCKQFKDKYQRSGVLIQVMDFPTLKWEEINTDFVFGLPRSRRQNY